MNHSGTERSGLTIAGPSRPKEAAIGESTSSLLSAETSGICEHLRPLLAGELAVGNRVRSREPGPLRPDAVVVMLEGPFSIDYTIRRPVIFERLNDPHWWGAEYRCATHGHQLLCPMLR